MPRSDSRRDDRPAKRRKVRKGTRSCWECRRRKIRCTFRSGDGSVCDGCQARETSCVSQHYDDGPESPESNDSPLAQRLSRVEDLLERLAEQVLQGSHKPRQDETTSSLSPSPLDDPLLGSSAVEGHRGSSSSLVCDVLLERSTGTTGNPTSLPNIQPAGEISAQSRYANLSQRLCSIYPSDTEINDVVSVCSSMPVVIQFFAPHELRTADNARHMFIAHNRPGPDSHPVLVAKQLVQLVHLYQQSFVNRPAALSADKFVLFSSRASTIIATVTELITSNDDLVGSFEGLETICLVALYHGNFGNLRKAWLGFRRGITIAQLMGLDRPRNTPVNCIDSRTAPSTTPKAPDIWFRLNFSDRYHSLLLGLPAASDDVVFHGSLCGDNKSAVAHLERVQCVASGKIIKRNHNKSTMSQSELRSIEEDLEGAARSMGLDWWRPPRMASTSKSSDSQQLNIIVHAMMQVNHYHLLILLHLPYMIKNVKTRQWEHSKIVCLRSCRELLLLFKILRSNFDGAAICRHTDYTAVTASLTLLLGYLDPRMRSEDQATTKTREADRQLIREVRQVLYHMAESKSDKLSMESYKIIGRLVPLAEVDRVDHDTESEMEPVALDIPYLGTINIKPVVRRSSQQVNWPVSMRGGSNNSEGRGLLAHQLSTPPSQQQQPPNHTQPAQREKASAPVEAGVGEAGASKWDFLTPPEAAIDCDESMLQFIADDAFLNQNIPDFSADVNEWTFQGYDAAFFENFMGQNCLGTTAAPEGGPQMGGSCGSG